VSDNKRSQDHVEQRQIEQALASLEAKGALPRQRLARWRMPTGLTEAELAQGYGLTGQGLDVGLPTD
jgi:hypothetical protein